MVPTFRVLTYNVHSCVGTDGRLDPSRIAEVIARSEADIVALQEVDVCQTRSDGLHQPQWLAERLRMFVHFTAARECNEGHYGNAILSRHPFALMSEGKLRRRRDETRAVQWLRLFVRERSFSKDKPRAAKRRVRIRANECATPTLGRTSHSMWRH